MSYAERAHECAQERMNPGKSSRETPPNLLVRNEHAKKADHRGDQHKLQESVKSILNFADDIRKETSILITVRLVGRSRSKVYDMINRALSIAEEAKVVLSDMSAVVAHPSGAESENGEQEMKRLIRQKLATNLLEASQKLETERKLFERVADAREKELSDEEVLRGISTPKNKNASPACTQDETLSSSSTASTEAHREAQLQQHRLESSLDAEIGLHTQRVERTAEDVGVIQRDVASLQRTMVDLGALVQSQTGMLDCIESGMIATDHNVDLANAEVAQANQRQARGSKLLYVLLVLAIGMAVLVIVAAMKKSGHKSH